MLMYRVYLARFWSARGSTTGGAFLKRIQQLVYVRRSQFWMTPSLGNVEPFSNATSTSLITYWRHSKNAGGTEWEKMWEKQPCEPQGQCRRRARRCSRAWSRDSRSACVKAVCRASCPTEVHSGTDLHPAVHQGPHATVLDISWRKLSLKEIPWWSTLQAGAADCWEDQVFCSTCDPMGDTC